MTSTQALCGYRILVAEDDALLAITLGDMLKSRWSNCGRASGCAR